MKRLLLIALTLLTLHAKAQDNSYNAILDLLESTPMDTVTAGDSLIVYYAMTPAVFKPERNTILQLIPNWFVNQSNPSAAITIYSDTSDGYRIKVDPTSSRFNVRVFIPANADTGVARIRQLIVNGSSMSVYIKKRTSVPTSIKTNANSPKKVSRIKFYTLTGAELSEPVVGQKCIRVEFYEDESFSSSLIMML